MLTYLLDCSSQTQKFILMKSFNRMHIVHCRRALRKRACFVDEKQIDFSKCFKKKDSGIDLTSETQTHAALREFIMGIDLTS